MVKRIINGVGRVWNGVVAACSVAALALGASFVYYVIEQGGILGIVYAVLFGGIFVLGVLERD